MAKANCWEFKACGREPGGAKVMKLGICPAAGPAAAPFEGMNGGAKAGRICWAVAGTLCGGQVQGSFAAKRANCETCDFFAAVKADEGDAFVLLPAGMDRGQA